MLLEILGPGDTFGTMPMFGDDVYPDTDEAQTDSCLLTITAADLRTVLERRVAASLLKLADQLGQDDRGAVLIQVPLTRQDLADMTGAQVETVSRIMSGFRKDGLIRSGRGWVAVVDRERLAAIAADPSR